MKTNGKMKGSLIDQLINNSINQGGGALIGRVGGQYYQTWANYFVKFLDAYAANNVTFWGVTTQNEPSSGFLTFYGWQTMGFTAYMMRDWIKVCD